MGYDGYNRADELTGDLREVWVILESRREAIVVDVGLIQREWVYELMPDEARVRCRYKRRARLIVEFTVQLEISHQHDCRPVVRFDNAHGFCHRDDLHPDGSQSKTA